VSWQHFFASVGPLSGKEDLTARFPAPVGLISSLLFTTTKSLVPGCLPESPDARDLRRRTCRCRFLLWPSRTPLKPTPALREKKDVPKVKRRIRKIPKFKGEDQERNFWASRDSTDYVDWRRAERVKLPNLRPTTRTIPIRLPESMIEKLKVLANKRDIPYQSLLKMFVADKIEEELRSAR
jgi:predicted DNA binding CopG/RHH family protein